MARRHLRLRWIATVAFFGISCGPVQRTPRTSVEIDGAYGTAVQRVSSCENGIEYSWEHRIFSGSAAIRHETASGVTIQGRLRLADDQITAYDRVSDAVPHLPYTGVGSHNPLSALGLHFAQAAQYAGVHIGGALVLGGRGVDPVPLFGLDLGNLDLAWLRARLGTDDPLYAVRIFSLGVGGRTEEFDFALEVGPYGRLVTDPRPDGEGLELTSTDMRVGLEFAYRPFEGFGITAATLLGTHPTGRVGLSWAFGGE